MKDYKPISNLGAIPVDGRLFAQARRRQRRGQSTLKRNCSGWPLEGAWHLQNSTENAEPAYHKIVWNDQIQAKVPGT